METVSWERKETGHLGEQSKVPEREGKTKRARFFSKKAYTVKQHISDDNNKFFHLKSSEMQSTKYFLCSISVNPYDGHIITISMKTQEVK